MSGPSSSRFARLIDNRGIDITVVVVLVIVFLVFFTVMNVMNATDADAAGWAYVWGWGPSKCGALGGTTQWIWDSVIKQPNWLCKYPTR